MKDNYLINGKKSLGLDPFDRGLAFGDGIFRTFKISDGNPNHWDYHFRKLNDDAKKLNINLPAELTLLGDIKLLFDKKTGVFIAKWIITRGSSTRGYSTPKKISPNRILLKSNFVPLENNIYLNGVVLEFSKRITSSHLYLGAIKHLNRLENILAKQELSKLSFDAIMFDENGAVSECISHNIFVRIGNVLHFPKQNHAGVSGVSKQIIIQQASNLGYTVKENIISKDQLLKVDELVIVNSVNGAIPVKQIKDKIWKPSNLSYEINQIFKKIK